MWTPALLRMLLLLASLQLSAAQLKIEVTDQAGKPLWTRMEVRGANDSMYQPEGALRDKTAHVKLSGPSWYKGHFVVEGKALLDVPPGRYTVVAEHGPEYERSETQVEVTAEAPTILSLKLHPWIRMNDLGWYSADMHVHRPLEDVPVLMRTENLNLAVSYTMWNTENSTQNRWTDHNGPVDPIEMVSPNQFHMIMNAEDERGGGAWMLIGLPGPFQMPAVGNWYPQGFQFVESARALRPNGGVLPWFECEKLIWWEVPAMMALGAPDSVSLLFNHFNQYGIHDYEAWGRPRDQKIYPGPEGFVRYVLGLHYRYLNLGFRFALTAGSASGVLQGPVGYNRVYARVAGPLTVDKYFHALKKGESFVTNGPMLFTQFHSRGRSVDIDVDARSREPIDRIEVIANGDVIRTIQPPNNNRTFKQRISVGAGNHSWIAVRCWQKDVPGFRLAHSAPFYLESKWDASADARYFTDWIDELTAITSSDPKRFATTAQRDEVLAFYRRARQVYAAKVSTTAEEQSLRGMAPIDAHAHIFANDPAIRNLLRRLDLSFINVTVIDPWERGYETMEPQHQNAVALSRAYPGRASWIATFDPADWESPGFAERVNRDLDQAFREGALGVKIYKTIGMELRSKDGRYIMPDEPVFSPILDFIASRGRTLYAHIAEPMGAWKPIDDSDPDSSYYRDVPHWHMYGHPERPAKAEILAGRDRMLAAHPTLRVVGCHLGSMEEDVDEIAQRLDRYPNLAVDTAARVTHLALQPRDKVRDFLIRYQDRILYATDDGLLPGEDAVAHAKRWEADLERDWRFFATTEPVEFMGRSVIGLGVPSPVLRKLYRENAMKWVPGISPGASDPSRASSR